jgi:hypothetical protein
MICKVCRMVICEDIDKIKDIKYIKCPNCNREPFLNPYFENGRDKLSKN